MSLAVPFLGPDYFQSIIGIRRQLGSAATQKDLVSAADELLTLSDQAARGLDSYYVHQTAAGVWRATMTDVPVLSNLRQRQWVAVRESNASSRSVDSYSFTRHRTALVRLSRYLLLLRRSLPTATQHTTLREWLHRQRCRRSGTSRIHGQAYRLPNELVIRGLTTLLDLDHDPVETWLNPVLAHYKQQAFPMRRSDIISLGLDIGLLYLAQAEQESRFSATTEAPGPALSLNELADLVASAFSCWKSSGALKLPLRQEPFDAPAYWQAVLGPMGDQGVFYHGSPDLWQGYPGGAGMPINPRLAARMAYSDLVRSDRELHMEAATPAVVPRYDYCASLKDLIDAATHPHLAIPLALICPVDGGWLSLLTVDGGQWHVRYLERRSKAERIARSKVDDQTANDSDIESPHTEIARICELGSLKLSLTSGEMGYHLMRMGESIPA